MRCSQVLERVCRRKLLFNDTIICWQAARAYAEASTDISSPGVAEVPIFAACVLQRLPIVRAPVPPHQAQHLIWSRQRGLETGELKDYPEEATKGRGDAGSKQEKQDLRTFKPVPCITSADTSGDVRSMRRQLREGLYLVVRSRVGQQRQGQMKDATDRSGNSSGGGGDVWGFPLAAHTGEESISDTAQRALHAVIGRSHPVFFVGRAPMAHLMAPQQGKTFFMLAQAVDDPWESMRLEEAGPAQDYAWATKQELLSTYLTDPRLRELARKML